jgi:LruC domain-containing protein
MKYLKLFAMGLLAFSMFSCEKKLEQLPQNTVVEDMDQLVVDQDFGWQAGMIGELKITFNNPYNVSTELELVNIVDQFGNIIKRNRIENAEVVFNLELPQNADYFIEFPVTGDHVKIEKLGNLVMDLGTTSSYKSAKISNEEVPSCTSCDNPIINPGAEAPAINTNYQIMHQDLVPGWETTASDKKIEIWTSGFNGVPAQEGNQFFELNANQVAHLYQELCLEPGSNIMWSVWHRGRSGVDVGEVRIGSSVENAAVVETMSDGTDAWGYYSGTYTVPEGQNTTYFVFTSVSSAGSASYGNFLDNFEIKCDYDGDGVPDDEDDCPADPNCSFTSNFPTSGKQVLAFEDLWPSMGDFDFNDMTLSNQVTFKQNADFELVEAHFKVSIDAIGAGLHNGIAMMLYDKNGNAFPSNIIESVSGPVSLDPLNTNGLILTDNVYSFIDEFYQNNGAGPTATPDTLEFTISFNNIEEEILPEIYIFRNNDRSHEVHRSNFGPTAAADMSLFFTREDNGNYQTQNGLPWGIEIIIDGSFKSPIEKIEIMDAYPDFQEWATSGGLLQTDWYTRPIEENVFEIPE